MRTLVNDSHLRRLEPTPLAPDTVEALLHRVFGAPIAEDSLEQLVDAATGNPGVLRQLVESARDAGNLVERDGMWHLTQPLVHASPTLELLVEERLAGLQEDERDVIELLAVAGELGLDLLEKMAGASVLEALERRGLLMVAKSAQRVEVSLSHPLFAEVINLQLPAVRGRRIRRTLADAADRRRQRAVVAIVCASSRGASKVAGTSTCACSRRPRVSRSSRVTRRWPSGSSLRRPKAIARPRSCSSSPSCASGGARRTRSRSCCVDRHRRARRRRARPGRAPAGDEPVLRPGRLLALGRPARGTLDDLTEPIDREGVEAYAVLLQAMGGEVDDAIARSDAMAPMSSEAAQLDLLRGRSLALAVAGRGEEALPLIAEARKLHDSLSADLRRPGLSLVPVRRGAHARRARAHGRGAQHRREVPRQAASLRCATGCCSPKRGSTCRSVAPTNVRRSSRWCARPGASGSAATERWALALLASGKLLEGDREGARVDLDRVAELEVGERGLFHADIDRAHAWLAAERAGLPTAREMLRVAADDARRLGQVVDGGRVAARHRSVR